MVDLQVGREEWGESEKVCLLRRERISIRASASRFFFTLAWSNFIADHTCRSVTICSLSTESGARTVMAKVRA
jgi:hypothetical protein